LFNLAYRNNFTNGDDMNKCLNCDTPCGNKEDFCCEECECEYNEAEQEYEEEEPIFPGKVE